MDKYRRRRIRKARQKLQRDIRAAEKQGKVWYAVFSEKAFGLPMMDMFDSDGGTHPTTRANVYLRPDGREVLITAVSDSLSWIRQNYRWSDKRLLGVVCWWDRHIYHQDDPRSTYNSLPSGTDIHAHPSSPRQLLASPRPLYNVDGFYYKTSQWQATKKILDNYRTIP